MPRALWCSQGGGVFLMSEVTATERELNNLQGLKDICLQNRSSKGHNLTLTVLVFALRHVVSGALERVGLSPLLTMKLMVS